MASLANWIKSQTSDYGQLKEAYPNAIKFGSALKKGISQLIPSNEDFKSPEAMRDWSTAAALNAPMGLTFIGKNAANWNPVKAAEAEKMLNAGVDPAQVWKEHLIGRMPDKSLFSEIDDSKQATQGLNMLTRALEREAIAQGAPRTMPSWVWMDHPELFDNYPHTSNTMINPTSSIESQGSFDPMSNILNLSAFSKDPKSTTLHEFQHAIQEKEGWARGGNPGMFNQQKEAELARDALNWRRELLHKRKDMPSADWYHVDNELVQDYQKQGIFDWIPTREARDLASQPYILHADKYDNGAGLKDLEDLVKMYGLDNRTTPYKPIEVYRRLTGEAQARATQDRMNMNMQQRRESYPLANDMLSDIPLGQLINRYGGNSPSMSIEDVANKNLNAGLLEKYLSTGKLSPKEMAQYEANGLAMETPQLQRYNVENANANPEMEAYKNSLYDSFHGGRESKKYDGTIESAINGFDLSKGGMGSGNRDGKLGVFSTNDPFVASEFAEKRNNPFVMPLKIRMDNPWQPENYKEISDLIDNHTQFKDSYKFPDGSNIRMVGDVINPEAARKELTDKGFDSVRLKNTLMDSIEGKPIDQYVSLDPKNIRSRFAAFDPLRKNSSSLLASLLGATALANEYDKNKKLKAMR